MANRKVPCWGVPSTVAFELSELQCKPPIKQKLQKKNLKSKSQTRTWCNVASNSKYCRKYRLSTQLLGIVAVRSSTNFQLFSSCIESSDRVAVDFIIRMQNTLSCLKVTKEAFSYTRDCFFNEETPHSNIFKVSSTVWGKCSFNLPL